MPKSYQTCLRKALNRLFPVALALALTALGLWPTAQILAAQHPEALGCSAALGPSLEVQKSGFGRSFRMLIWNIQKAQNPGWDTDLRKATAKGDHICKAGSWQNSGFDLAFVVSQILVDLIGSPILAEFGVSN